MYSIHLSSPNASFQSSLEDTLSGINVRIQENSPYQLIISDYKLKQTQPSIIIANAPATVTYSLSLTAQLKYKQKQIASKKFSSSQSLIQNINSLNAQPANASLIIQFQNDIIEQIYLWLGSNAVRKTWRRDDANKITRT